MKLFKVLNAYAPSFSLSKSNVYKEVERYKKAIQEEGFLYTPKKIDALFMLEIIYKGIQNKQRIEDMYYSFMNQNQDVFSHITYQQKQVMIQEDMKKTWETLPSFKKGEDIIYVPYLEPFINQRMVSEYQMLALKEHQKYMTDFPKTIATMQQMYGLALYKSNFSSLHFIKEDATYAYFYFMENKTVYIVNVDFKIEASFCLVDRYHTYQPTIPQIENIVSYIQQTTDEKDCLTYLYEQGCLSEKGYKKMSKKIGR